MEQDKGDEFTCPDCGARYPQAGDGWEAHARACKECGLCPDCCYCCNEYAIFIKERGNEPV